MWCDNYSYKEERMNISIKKILIVSAIFCLIGIPAVSADTLNFTRIIPSSDLTIINQSFAYNGSPHTPLPFFLLMFLTGLAFLGLSVYLKPEQCNDLFAYIAPVPLFFSAIMSLGIDVHTSSGISTIMSGTLTKYVLIENHTIYSIFLLTVFIAILIIISIANIVRVQRQHKMLQFEQGQPKEKREEY